MTLKDKVSHTDVQGTVECSEFLRNLATPSLPLMSSQEQEWHGILVEQHRHPFNELVAPAFSHHTIVILLGEPVNLVQHLNGHTYQGRKTKGDITVFPAGQPSKWQWEGEADILHIHIKPEFLAQIATEASHGKLGQVELLNQFNTRDPLLENLGLTLKAEAEVAGKACPLYAESLIHSLAVHLLRRYSVCKKSLQDFKGGMSKHKLQRIIEYINHNLEQNLTLETIANEVEMSPYHFARLFKQSIGLPPHQYVINCRIERAKALLAERDLPLAQICQLVGFQSQSHFTTLFRKLTTMTPKAYRDAI